MKKKRAPTHTYKCIIATAARHKTDMSEQTRFRSSRRFGLSRIEHPKDLIPVALLVLIVWFGALVVTRNAQAVSDAVSALGILAGGLWVGYQFALRRAFESSLSIDVRIQTYPQGRDHLVSFEITLTNTGNRSLAAPDKISYDIAEYYECSVKYPGDLQIKRIKDVQSPAFLGWWSTKTENLNGLPEHISLLHEYTDREGDIDFFMEPEEKYLLGANFILPAGDYLAKVVFVGDRRSAAEFWSRIVHFRVPTSPKVEEATGIAV